VALGFSCHVYGYTLIIKAFHGVVNETKRHVILKVFKPGTMPNKTVSATLGDLLDFSEVSSGDTKS
jgi:hypothetical protein